MTIMQWIRVWCLTVLSFVPAVLSVYCPQLSGEINLEQRQLQDLPGVPTTRSQVGQWPRLFDQFASDRFPFRDRIVKFASLAVGYAGVSLSPEVLIGQQGWLFLAKASDVVAESRGVKQWSKQQLETASDQLLEWNAELAHRECNLYLVVVPNKHTVYRELLPRHQSLVGPTITDDLLDELKLSGFHNVIDLRPALRNASRQQKVYDKFNTHWNDFGAFIGYQEILKKVPHSSLVGSDSVSFESVERAGDLSRLIGNSNLREMTFDAKIDPSIDGSRLTENDRKRAFGGKIANVSFSSDPKERVLVVCDSFVLSFLYKYLECSFESTSFAHFSMHKYRALVEETAPTSVLLILVERNLCENLVR